MGTSTTNSCSIQNFRAVAGFDGCIYRCASTDKLANVIRMDATPEEVIVFDHAGLILDLRSASERNEDQAATWMNKAGVTATEGIPGQTVLLSSKERRVLRIDVLSPTRFFAYATEHWLNPTDKALAGAYRLFNPNKLHVLHIEALNRRGLAGLNEAILETGKKELCLALRAITVHIEEQRTPVVIHCVQGKDRTGLLSMLCQSMYGISDEDIIEDYFKSDVMRIAGGSTSAAAEGMELQPGKLDKKVLSGAPRETMVDTLEFIRLKYGSVTPGYLDEIGFDRSWRKRFQSALAMRSKL